MRSDAEIRKQVEARLRRWGLLALNVILWVGAAKLIYGYSQYGNFGQFTGAVALVMVSWAALVGLHALRTFYVEGREWLVSGRLSGSVRFTGCKREKRKRDDSASLPDDLPVFPSGRGWRISRCSLPA